MTTCFIDIVNMFLKNVLKTRKRFKNQSPIKLLFITFSKHHLDILKTFLKCQIVSWVSSFTLRGVVWPSGLSRWLASRSETVGIGFESRSCLGFICH